MPIFLWSTVDIQANKPVCAWLPRRSSSSQRLQVRDEISELVVRQMQIRHVAAWLDALRIAKPVGEVRAERRVVEDTRS